MATAALDFDPAREFAEKIATDAETGRIAQWPADQIKIAIYACDFLRSVFSRVRESIESGLCEGVDAQAFATKYEQSISDLDPVLRNAQRVVSKSKMIPDRALADRFQLLVVDLVDLRTFLQLAVSKARTSHTIDWNKVHEAQAAYSRGETRPWERSSAARATDS